ncbi:MAG: response regulator [Campylobacterota bacterium]|nr:response regulator [Campylobacterota bacterium]
MKYLITDDSKIARKFVLNALTKFVSDDDVILQASNGEEAISIYKEHKPDLCFMDLTMPLMDGFEATLNICNFDKNAKVIIISADVQQSAVVKAKEYGAIGFINKSIDKIKMKDILTKLGYI